MHLDLTTGMLRGMCWVHALSLGGRCGAGCGEHCTLVAAAFGALLALGMMSSFSEKWRTAAASTLACHL